MYYVFNDSEIKKFNKIARKRYIRGLKPDKLLYKGKNGRYEMKFNGKKYIPAFRLKNCSLDVGFNCELFEDLFLK